MKNNRIFRSFTKVALTASFLLALASVSNAANLVYFVTLDVASLVSNPNGLFALDLQLVPGSNNVTNSVTLSNFIVTGGTLTGSPDFTFGGATGSSASSITLTNSNSSDNEYAELFSSGVTRIQFQVTETSNSETVGSGTPIPEQFNVAIYDNTQSNIPTTDPSGGNTLVSSAIVAGQTLSSVQTFTSMSPDAGVSATVSLSAVPEPTSVGLLLVGACGLLARRKRSAQPSVA
ncbi:MAG TPA: NF038129 family PEP-CTERM protein [Chthoniobacter sp.]|nr:NF038129 family PEP-CTERM protein [Chthoniobacter sp.]